MVSSLVRKAFGVGGRFLLVRGLAEVGEGSGDFRGKVFRGVGRRGLRAGVGAEAMLVWIFRGERGGAGRAAAGRKGLVEAPV